MKRALLSTLVALSLGITVPAMAQTPARGKPAAGKGSDAKGFQRVKNYDFEADNIAGELVRPEGEFSTARKFAEHSSLIRPRLDFIREIVKSAEDL